MFQRHDRKNFEGIGKILDNKRRNVGMLCKYNFMPLCQTLKKNLYDGLMAFIKKGIKHILSNREKQIHRHTDGTKNNKTLSHDIVTVAYNFCYIMFCCICIYYFVLNFLYYVL